MASATALAKIHVSAVSRDLFSAYEIKPEKRRGTVLLGYGILLGLVVAMVIIPLLFPTVAPNFLRSKISSVDLVTPLPPEVVPERHIVRTAPPPPPPVSAAPEITTPIRIQTLQTPSRTPHVDQPAAMPAPAAPKEMLQPNVLAALPSKPAMKPIHTGAFGDPNGVPAQTAKMNERGPELGSFGTPASSTNQSAARGVATGAFGVPGGKGPSQAVSHNVSTGAFGTPTGTASTGTSKGLRNVEFSEPAVQVAKVQPVVVKVAPIASVVILSKPAPVYTEEARRLHIEGDVAMEVVFTAGGQVQITRIAKGLGHGLDEAASVAARQIRFTPARRDGQPIDYPATIHIIFALS